MMDLFSGSDDDLTLEDLPKWRDTEPVQQWRERYQEAQAELNEAKSKLHDLQERRRKRRSSGVLTNATEAIRERLEKGTLDERIEKARRDVDAAKLKVAEIEEEKEEAFEDALPELEDARDDLLPEAIEDYIEALRQFEKAKSRLRTLDSWVNNVNMKFGETTHTSAPLKVPYTLEYIPGLDSPIGAERLADNLESDA